MTIRVSAGQDPLKPVTNVVEGIQPQVIFSTLEIHSVHYISTINWLAYEKVKRLKNFIEEHWCYHYM